MAGSTSIPLATLAPGSYDFGPTSLADADTMAKLSVDRTPANGFNSQPATTQAQISVSQSSDGGATWEFLGGAGFIGGTYPYDGKPGNPPYLVSSCTIWFLPGSGRIAKATVVIIGASVAVSGSLVIS